MPGSALDYQLVSITAEERLVEFSTAFDAAYVAAESTPWAMDLGLVINSRYRQRIPVPVDAPCVKLASGDDHYRELYVGDIEFEPAPYSDGIKEKSDVIEAPDFVGWGQAPENMAREFRRNLNAITAAMLEANPYLDIYRVRRPGGNTASTINLFSASHKVNLIDSARGTQSNVIAQGTYVNFTEDLHTAVRTHFSGWKAANGEKMELVATDLLVPTGRVAAAEKYYGRDTIIEEGTAGVIQAPNIYQNAVKVHEVAKLTDADYVYYVCRQIPAWVVQTGGTPDEIRFDKTSDSWKRDGLIKIGYRAIQGVAGLLPHGILRVDLKATSR